LSEGKPTRTAPVGGFALQKKPSSSGSYPTYTPYDSNQGWHGEWFYIQNPVEAPFPPFTGRRPKRKESWSWSPSSRQNNKLGIIEVEPQKILQHSLDRVRVFYTLFHHRVAPLVERTRPMWLYSGPTDPDCMSPVELAKDEVWSRLDRVLQLKTWETLEGKPRPFHTDLALL